MLGPTWLHCTRLGKGETVRLPTPSWDLRLVGGVMGAGRGRWRKGGGTLSWAPTRPPIHVSPFPADPVARPSPGPSATVPASLADGPNHLPPPGSGRLLASFSQPPPLPLTRGSPVWPHSYLLSCGLHTCSGFPSHQHPLLCAFSLTSPPRRPSSLPSSPFPVCSQPGRLHPPLHPEAPGSRAPLPFPLSCYPGFLRLSPRHSSLPLVPPSHLPAPSLPNFFITVPGLPGAGPPMPGSARSRRREEERQRPGGAEQGPAAETAPPPGPPPDPPPAPNPPFHTLQGRSGSGGAALCR